MTSVKQKRVNDRGIEFVLFICASLSVVIVIFITVFIIRKGIPLFSRVPIQDFLFGRQWFPTDKPPQYGILPFILGSIYVTFGSLLIAVPIGLASGIYLAEIAKGRFARILKSVVELLAGIPSVIFGFFGVVVIAPMVRVLFGGSGFSLLSACIILSIMILPTIINLTEVSIRAVPDEFREGSFALGATHWQTIYKVLVPSARSGILAGIVLGMGRAVGETMAVLMVGGNPSAMPAGLTKGVRTLTMNIVTDMSYASGDHMTSLFTTGLVLFVFILLLNSLVQVFIKRSRGRKET